MNAQEKRKMRLTRKLNKLLHKEVKKIGFAKFKLEEVKRLQWLTDWETRRRNF